MNNLKQLGLALHMYQRESRGNLFPPIMATAATLYDCDSPYTEMPRGFEKKSDGVVLLAAPLLDAIYPEYLTVPGALNCPAFDKRLKQQRFGYLRSYFVKPGGADAYETDEDIRYFDLYCQQPGRGAGFATVHYAYTGYACYGGLEDEDDTRAAHEAGQLREVLTPLLEAKQRGDGKQLRELADKDVATSPEIAALGAKEAKVYRLRDGVERFLITDANNVAASAKAQSEIWVMHDVLHADLDAYSHVPAAVNVLYLDGRVECKRVFQDSRDESPATREMRASYALLD